MIIGIDPWIGTPKERYDCLSEKILFHQELSKKTMEIQLSILIASIPHRLNQLTNVLETLYKQFRPGVEIIVLIDPMDLSLGERLNQLLHSAKGKYVVFVDDDDMVKDNYIEKIFEGIEKDVDSISIQTEYYVREAKTALIVFGKDNEWIDRGDTYYRPVAKFCPHKREIALQVMFPLTSIEEDRPYAFGINKLIKTEHKVEIPLYEYHYWPKDHNRKLV